LRAPFREPLRLSGVLERGATRGLAQRNEAQRPLKLAAIAAEKNRPFRSLLISGATNESLTVRADHAAHLLLERCATMPAFTLGTASQATGCAKSTILRAIRAGRISASRDDTGQWAIDPAELFRVFPALALPATGEKPQMERDATADVLVAELRAVIADLRRGQDDLRQERDKWQVAHEREQAAHAATQRLLLPPPATVQEQGATAPGQGAPATGTPRNGLRRTWRWLRSTG
jgi:hypothetical protein